LCRQAPAIGGGPERPDSRTYHRNFSKMTYQDVREEKIGKL